MRARTVLRRVSARSGEVRLNGRMLELTALEQENKEDILASPRLYATHQQTASIKQGTQIPYLMTSGHGKYPSIQFKEAVLCMEVTLRILAMGTSCWICG